MQPGVIYRLQWNTVPSVISATVTIPAQAMVVDILDTETLIPDVDTPVVIPLKASGNPLVISIINNDRDKFSPIRAKQAKIEFQSDRNAFQDITTFSDSSDNRWKVNITADGDPVFYGFLILIDSQMAFQPDPNLVVLTATDHLGSLKNPPLKDAIGANPIGKYRLAELIALCLKQTGLTLDIVAINNLRSGSGQLVGVSAEFSTAIANTITFTGNYDFFYLGQRLIITGTTSNNGTFTVTGVTTLFGLPLISVQETVVNESAASATITDELSSLHIYDGIYLDAKTAEANIGESISCYEMLEIILRDCFLSQWLGKWYIMRVDEYDGNPIYPATFDSDGVFVSFDAATSFSKSIGETETRRLANADALLQSDRAHKFIKINYGFNLPQEIIDNQDFARGTIITDTPTEKTFTLDDWSRVIVDNSTGAEASSTDFDAYIKKNYDQQEYIIDQKAVLEYGTFVTGSRHWVKSNPIPMKQNDKFDLTLEWRFSDLVAGSTEESFFATMIILNGNDGSKWIYTNPPGSPLPQDFFEMQWVDYSTAPFYHSLYYNFIPDETDVRLPNTLDGNIKALPVDGEVVIYLGNYNKTVVSGIFERDVYYSGLSIEYIPYINGSYKRYTGQSDRVTRDPDAGYFESRDEEIRMNDSPKPLFKGAMFWFNGTDYILTDRWYTAAPFYTADPPASLGTPPDTTYLHPYAYIHAFSVWNQYVNANRIISGSVLGLGSMWCDAFDKISLTDNNVNTNNRYFMLISFEQNWKTALWSGVFIEDYRTDIGKVYSDTHQFEYLTK